MDLWVCVGLSSRGRLSDESVSISFVYVGVSSVGVCRGLLRVVDGGRWGV